MTAIAWQRTPGVEAAQRRTLRLLSVAQIVGGIGFGAGLSVGVLLAERVTGSEGWAGVARTGTTVGAAALAIPLAMLAIRAGRRVSLGTGWMLAAIGSALLVVAAVLTDAGGPADAGLSPAVRTGASAALIAGMLACGAGSAASLQSRYAAVDLAPQSLRSRHLSLVVWATTVGTVLGPNLGGPGELVSRSLHLAPMAGPFVIAAALQAAAALVVLALRPDPLLLATSHHPATPTARPGVRRALATAWQIPAARTALVTIAVAQTVMVSVMTMTPVQMDHHGASITVVGITISLHILGMYALSPLVGVAADRWGRTPVITAGGAVLLVAALIAGTSGQSTVRMTIGLMLIGIGWSLCLVAGSTLLTESVGADVRTAVQGGADAAMNVAAAVGAAASGPLLGIVGFGGLNALAASLVLLAMPWVLVRRRVPGLEG